MVIFFHFHVSLLEGKFSFNTDMHILREGVYHSLGFVNSTCAQIAYCYSLYSGNIPVSRTEGATGNPDELEILNHPSPARQGSKMPC